MMKRILTALIPLLLLAAAGCGGNDPDPVEKPGGEVENPDKPEKPDEPEQPGEPEEPPVDESLVCIDAPLLLEVPAGAELGTEGCIRVYDDLGVEADVIDLADLANVTVRTDGQMIPKAQITPETMYNTTMDVVPSGGRFRIIHYTPLRLTEKGLEIKLHSGVLDFGKEYTVTVDPGVVKDHAGVAQGEWTVKTKAKPVSTSELRVNADGTGDFCTVQGAVTYAGKLGKATAVTISVATGTYRETVFIRDKNNLTIKGDSRYRTFISYGNNEGWESGSGASTSTKGRPGRAIGASGGRGVILAENCDNLVFEDLTLQNTFGEQKGQAEVIYFNSSNRMTIENCALHSLQDTFLCKGTVWVHKSLIAGHCDFIWGYPKACLFEDCEIRAEAAGYIVQARVQNASDKGFVFLNCKLTAADGVKAGSMFLARSGGDAKNFDNVTFINCAMDAVIATAGWYTNPSPNPSSPSAASGWKEYGTTDLSGRSLDLSGRSRCGCVLTAAEAEAFSSKAAVLGS